MSLLVRATVQLPPDATGRLVPPGASFFADDNDPFVATQLSVGHLVPVGPIPSLTEDDTEPKKK